MKHLKELKNEFSTVKLLLERQNTECKATVKDMLDQKSSITQSIAEYKEEIKTLEVMTKNYQQQKREYKFYKKCLKERKYGKVYTTIKGLSKECPICFEEMQPPTKIFQCSQGHFFCENCYKKVTESTKTCPFCKRDVASNPITNRALDKVIETEARTEVGAGSEN